MPRVPDRWDDYCPMGKVIEGTRFISFKVPLQDTFHMTRDNRFTPEDLISRMEAKGLRLGLVIDLTFTKKYYEADEQIKSKGIDYHKVFVPGKVVPDKSVQKQFANIVDKFLESNSDNDKLIGVHCTHGLNRTGYLVCRYMINYMDFSPEDAIREFNKARGHTMERGNYLEDLKGGKTDLSSVEAAVSDGHPDKGKDHRKGKRGRNKDHKNRHHSQRERTIDYASDEWGPTYQPWKNEPSQWQGGASWSHNGHHPSGHSHWRNGHDESWYHQEQSYHSQDPYHSGYKIEGNWRDHPQQWGGHGSYSSYSNGHDREYNDSYGRYHTDHRSKRHHSSSRYHSTENGRF